MPLVIYPIIRRKKGIKNYYNIIDFFIDLNSGTLAATFITPVNEGVYRKETGVDNYYYSYYFYCRVLKIKVYDRVSSLNQLID